MVSYFNYTCPKTGVLRQCSIDSKFRNNLDILKNRLKKKDRDELLIVTGIEGSGKSVKAMQIASYVDPTFNLTNICFSSEEFKRAVMNAKPRQAVIFDEAHHGLSSRSALSKQTRMLTSLIQTCRQKNLFILILIPSIFMLDRYISMHRATALIHTFIGKNNRHIFFVFNRKNKMKVLLEGKKTMDYGRTIKKNPSIYRGTYTNCYCNIDEEEYRKKKMKAFLEMDSNDSFGGDDSNKNRNKILYLIYKEFDKKPQQISDLLSEYGVTLGRTTIQDIIFKIRREKQKEASFKLMEEVKGGIKI